MNIIMLPSQNGIVLPPNLVLGPQTIQEGRNPIQSTLYSMGTPLMMPVMAYVGDDELN